MSVEENIDKIINEINENPLIFHREADISAMLFNELNKKYNKLHETALGYKTGAVHCEYFGGGRTRFDLVVFNEDDIQRINKESLEISKSKEYVKLDVAIEIKTDHGWHGKEKMWKLIENDINKLVKLRQVNRDIQLFYIYIVRSDTTNERKKDYITKNRIRAGNECKKHNITFKSNDEKHYFLRS